ncbi:MAG TPA: 50S ribosomal protein L3 N(5)-glutamine methyltransferase [Burkholderiales bacterium]|nr:50S ribosomal protein L3 N(5)-glutamine methyltransferase [Burkholderiales bacterium]
MPPPEPVTVGGLFRDAVRRLEHSALHYGHGTHNARDDAAYLILHTLDLPLDDLRPHLKRIVTPLEQRHISALIERRIREKIPVAYLTHEAWLGDYRFYVDQRVIIPRSFIAELARERFQPWIRRKVRGALDLCTGSGCLAVLLAKTFPQAKVDAADVSPGALAVARRNVARYRLGRRIRLVRSDLFSALKGRRYDLIVCNPPYVKAASMRALPPEHRHEPVLALAGGADGLSLVRQILAQSAGHLRPGGSLVCEIGHNRRELERAYPSVPFAWPETSIGPGHVFALERAALVALSGVA